MIDATGSFKDGKLTKVIIKRVSLMTDELPLLLMHLSSPSMREDPRNIRVPVLDVILIPACESHALIVMPMFWEHVALPFRCVGEVLEMFLVLSKVSGVVSCRMSSGLSHSGMFKGLEFLHDNNVAHR